MENVGQIAAVCVSEKKGTVKTNVNERLLIKGFGLVGDAHAGSERQVSLLSVESVREFEKRTGIELKAGAFGENLLTEKFNLSACGIGTRLLCGEALLEIIKIGKECHKDCEIRAVTGDCIMPNEGVFAKVLSGGSVKTGDEIRVIKERPISVSVLVSSDRAYYGGYEDLSGSRIFELCKEHNYDTGVIKILPDDEELLYRELVRMADEDEPDIIFTTGGTGFSKRDRMPEATLRAGERNAPGIAEALRAYSMTITPNAMLSRAVSVIRGKTLIINLPGSPKAVSESLDFLLPKLTHGVMLLRGEADA